MPILKPKPLICNPLQSDNKKARAVPRLIIYEPVFLYCQTAKGSTSRNIECVGKKEARKSLNSDHAASITTTIFYVKRLE